MDELIKKIDITIDKINDLTEKVFEMVEKKINKNDLEN
jgi:hypothetical protein